MLFNFKQSTVTVDCFTYHHSVYDNYKPLPTNKFIPEEWRKLPKSIDVKAFPNDPTSSMTIPNATLKTCNGFIDLFSTGFVLQMWSDLYLDVDSSGKFKASSPSNAGGLDQHPSFQIWDSFYENCGHIKIVPPWVFKETTGVKFFWSRCAWNNTDMAGKFYPLTGVVDYKHQHTTAINMFIPNSTSVKFSAGQPMIQLVPMTEKKVVLKYHLISMEEYNNRFNHQGTYTKLYNENKRASEFNKTKCPFGFGK